jgi:hypothetical protein
MALASTNADDRRVLSVTAPMLGAGASSITFW